MKIGIVVLNYNNHEMTLRLVEEISRNVEKKTNIGVVVVDNFHSDKEKENITLGLQKYLGSNFYLIKNSKNLGYGEGNNKGIKLLMSKGYDKVLILNNDVVVDALFFEGLSKISEDDFLIAGPIVYDEAGDNIQSCGGRVLWYNGNAIINQRQYSKIDFLSGCCLLLNLDKLKNDAFFDNDFFLYYEDVHLCHLIYKKYKVEPKIFNEWNVRHIGGASSKNGSKVQIFNSYRSKVIFHKKNSSFLYCFYVVFYSFMACILNTIIKKNTVYFFSGIKGLVDGILRR